MKSTYVERLWMKIEREPGGCWRWTGYVSAQLGYGYVRPPKSAPTPAHRAVYEVIVGPVPGNKVLDHLCRNRWCVNPAHVEPVTIAENTARGAGVQLKTHCAQGHPRTPENLYVYGKRNVCKPCKNARNRARQAARNTP